MIEWPCRCDEYPVRLKRSRSLNQVGDVVVDSAAQKTMRDFDELPPEVRAALSAAYQPSDQMIDVLCNMHRNGFPQAALLKVIAANNATNDSP